MKNSITLDKYKKIRNKYGQYASWAIWSEEESTPKSNMCPKIFESKATIKSLHSRYVLVGLNISRPLEKKFSNFHPDYSEAQDYKTRYALKNTPLWGAYMTDIIKDFEEVVSGKMMKYLKENPEFEKINISTFRKELKFISTSQPILVAIGKDSYTILKRNLKEDFKIIKIPHYANYISKEKYREQVLGVLHA
jgi:hypothetical protein